ncbi:translation initiation factor IF-2 [Streptomyces sparsogenes]|uniref:translation initiation factor IF-2 n=1 Tax=Streptomyces sparsogenes TaxID=67365 RepID=UPI003316FCDE
MNTVPARPAAPPEHPPVRGLLWLVGRQHRAALCAGLALVAAVAAYILWMRADMVGYLRAHGIEGCAQWRAGCGPHSEAYAHVDRAYRDPLLNTGRLILALPALAGVFLGAPLFARELESGTHRLMWSQSVGRVRWAVAKLALPAAAVLAGTTALSALYTWWWRAARLALPDVVWGTAVPFDTTGPAQVALAALLFFLGAAIGLLLPRTLPAMAATLAAGAGAQYGLDTLRPHLMPRTTVVSDATGDFGRVPDEVFHTSWRGGPLGQLTPSGAKIPLERCLSADGVSGTENCLARLGATRRAYEELHPASHYWPLQWIQAGICLSAAAALAAFCVWWVRRRPAVKETA